MLDIHSAAADQPAPADLISFLKAIPDGRYRRGVRYPLPGVNYVGAPAYLIVAGQQRSRACLKWSIPWSVTARRCGARSRRTPPAQRVSLPR